MPDIGRSMARHNEGTCSWCDHQRSLESRHSQTIAEITEWCHEQMARTDDPNYTPADLFIAESAKEVLQIIERDHG